MLGGVRGCIVGGVCGPVVVVESGTTSVSSVAAGGWSGGLGTIPRGLPAVGHNNIIVPGEVHVHS